MIHNTCKRCLYTIDHPLGLVIDEEGICSGCRVHEEKDLLDWSERWQQLEQLVKPYRISDKRQYDCIVPVTGGQDSYYIVHLVKERLGLNPLLVTYNKYWNTPLGIRNLANLRIRFNCDIVIQNVNPISVKKVVKETLRSFGSLYWHCIAGQTVFPVQTAVRYKIPLIIWGAHQGLEQVGMFSHEHEVEMTRRYRKEHDLMGYEADDLITHFNTLTETDVWQYRYPDDQALNDVGVRGIYLGNYVRWDPLAQHHKMIDMHDYKGANFARTFDRFDYVDCFNYMDLHDQIKQSKCGYGKVLDHACREIRHGRLNRDEAVTLVERYQVQTPKYGDLLFDWLGVNQRGFEFVTDLFAQNKPFDAKITSVGDELSLDWMTDGRDLTSLEMDRDREYITIGKGLYNC
ncbi:N-acetyl sugar amidotransferase [Thalassolituus oleivorans]|uniref:N-acetyl sugar amidotransferase n=1 Tax=Thalassolituus oleivorans TaxID=187493 RepID=UPI00240A6544|nr:N-acetyl sugar amidotransferase [Thalassolituus oleivorans]MDF1642018.1 N-acetyl sugar amidotransferase [Thalassolituus oleivorans]